VAAPQDAPSSAAEARILLYRGKELLKRSWKGIEISQSGLERKKSLKRLEGESCGKGLDPKGEGTRKGGIYITPIKGTAKTPEKIRRPRDS